MSIFLHILAGVKELLRAKKKSPGKESREREKVGGSERKKARERIREESCCSKEGEQPEGTEEQLLRVSPLRTSLHSTGSSHRLTLQHGSCLESNAHTRARLHTCVFSDRLHLKTHQCTQKLYLCVLNQSF